MNKAKDYTRIHLLPPPVKTVSLPTFACNMLADLGPGSSANHLHENVPHGSEFKFYLLIQDCLMKHLMSFPFFFLIPFLKFS